MPENVLPPPRWAQINDRWHSGARVSAGEIGELLDMALEAHLASRRLEAEAERLRTLLSEAAPLAVNEWARWREPEDLRLARAMRDAGAKLDARDLNTISEELDVE